MILWDSSALLAFLLDEPGASLVEDGLTSPTRCSAANWSEIAQKLIAHQRDWPAARALLHGMDVVVEPVTATDAERAAALWPTRRALSLADRLCLATGLRLEAEIWTADGTWGDASPIRQIR